MPKLLFLTCPSLYILGKTQLYFQFPDFWSIPYKISDAQSVKLTFSLIATFYLTNTENRTNKSKTALVLLLRVMVLFLTKNADFMHTKKLTSTK